MIFAKVFGFILKSVSLDSCCKFLGSAAILLAAAFLAWHFLVPGRPDADPSRKKIADRAILKLADDLRRHRGDIKHVAVVHFRNDASDYFTLNLREKLATSGVFDVEDAAFSEKMNYMLKLRNKGSFDTAAAVKHGKSLNVQAVITGHLERFESMKRGALVVGTVRLISIPEGKIIAEIPVNESNVSSFFNNVSGTAPRGAEGTEIGGTPWHIRFLIFILVMLLLPVLSIAFIRFMVAKRSNKCNVFVLGIYTMVDLILAWFMCGGFVSGLSVIIFFAAAVSAFIYNASIMSFALKLES